MSKDQLSKRKLKNSLLLDGKVCSWLCACVCVCVCTSVGECMGVRIVKLKGMWGRERKMRVNARETVPLKVRQKQLQRAKTLGSHELLEKMT